MKTKPSLPAQTESPRNDRAVKQGFITEAKIKEALTKCHGDLMVASAYLKCGPTQLDRYIRASEELQAFASAVKQVKLLPEFEAMSSKQFTDELNARTRAYMLEGLDVIRDIAVGPAEDAASRKVKLDAAVALRGSHVQGHQASDLEMTLEELNRLYREHAPRIVEIRQTTMRIETRIPDEEPRLLNP